MTPWRSGTRSSRFLMQRACARPPAPSLPARRSCAIDSSAGAHRRSRARPARPRPRSVPRAQVGRSAGAVGNFARILRSIVMRGDSGYRCLPGLSHRRTARRRGSNKFAADSSLEEAVRSELVSETPISLLAGKIQGNSSIWASKSQVSHRSPKKIKGLQTNFPMRWNRELIVP